MALSDYRSALELPDNHASHAQLYEFVQTQDFSDISVPTVAEDYLHAFYDTACSHVRRRWVGIVLARMLKASHHVAQYFKQPHLELHKIGNIILSVHEREETKIVAGIFMRQALEHKIPYSRFWASERVWQTESSFPKLCGAQWMSDFQSFLDVLTALVSISSVTDPAIIYPVELSLNDLERQDEGNAVPIALIQASIMTIITTDDSLHTIHFVDIPITHIRTMKSRQTTLTDSQHRHMKPEAWEFILTLDGESWTYCLDSSMSLHKNMTMLFEHHEDADEWENCILEHQLSKSKPSVTTLRNTTLTSSSPKVSQPIASTSKDFAPRIEGNDEHELKLVANSAKTKVTYATRSKKTGHAEAIHPMPQGSRQRKPAINLLERLPPLESSSGNSVPDKVADARGKVTGISKETKAKIVQQSLIQLKVNNAHNNVALNSSRKSKIATQSMKSSPCVTRSSTIQGKMCTKRKAVDDDGDKCIPQIQKQKKKKKATQKQNSTTAESEDPFAENGVDQIHTNIAREVPEKERGSASRTTVAQLVQFKQPVVLQSTKSAHNDIPPSSASPSHNSLIDGFLHPDLQERGLIAPQGSLSPVQIPQTPDKPANDAVISTKLPPLTPTNAQQRLNGRQLSYNHSSPAPGTMARERWSSMQYSAGTTILSSNSKPLPASPNAESTAISGHADCADVSLEVKLGEIQTAKSNPFKHRRVGQKATSFVRRLTGEPCQGDDTQDRDDRSHERTPFANLITNRNAAQVSHPNTISTAPSEQMALQSRKAHPSTAKETFKHNIPQVVKLQKSSVTKLNQMASPLNNVQTMNHPQSSPTALANRTSKTRRHLGISSHRSDFVEKSFVAASSRVADSSPLHRMLPESKNNHCNDVRTQTGVEALQECDSILFHDEDLDMALVNQNEDDQIDIMLNASSIRFCSSPPVAGTPSSRNSTSLINDSPLTPMVTSQAEEMEWEASLLPHQRTLHDLLMRTSKRVMQHIVSNEDTVASIADEYADNGEHILDDMLKRYKSDFDEVLEGVENKAKHLTTDLENALSDLTKQRRRMKAIM